MRLTSPPRHVAAQLRLSATVRSAWAFAGTSLLISLVLTVDILVQAGELDHVALPTLSILAFGGALAVMAAHPTPYTAAGYLAVGALAIGFHSWALHEAGVSATGLATGGLTLAMCLAGSATGNERSAAAWTVSGFLLGQFTLLSNQFFFDVDYEAHFETYLIAALYTVVYLSLSRSSRAQARIVPDSAPVEAELARHEKERMAANRAAALVHETILSDLAMVAHGPSQLSDNDRARLHRDTAAVSGAKTVALRSPKEPVGEPNDFYGVVRELQWRGLSIDVGGSSYSLELLDDAPREAMLGAVREALENVLLHSGVDVAEVFIDVEQHQLTVMIVDEGCGFILEDVADDRLGLRVSVSRCIEDNGGSVTVWSTPGAGTSVVLALPLADLGRVFDGS